jgi:hypothetical protein
MKKYFEFWDPVKGHPSYAPINSAQTIPYKAREILKNRSTNEIQLMVSFVDQTMDEFYQQEVDRVKDAVQDDKNWKMVETDEDGHITDLLQEAKDHYNLIDQDYPFIYAVDHVLSNSDIDLGFPFTDTPEPKEYELWAALSLSQYAEYIYKLEHVFNYKTLTSEKRVEKNYDRYEIVSFCNLLLDAQAMLLNAVELHTAQKIEDKTKIQLEKTQEQNKLKRTEISKNANLARHNKTNELKQNILTMWHKNCADFETIKAAGDHYEEAMIAQGYKITSETIRGYISEYAKTVGFIFPRHQK